MQQVGSLERVMRAVPAVEITSRLASRSGAASRTAESASMAPAAAGPPDMSLVLTDRLQHTNPPMVGIAEPDSPDPVRRCAAHADAVLVGVRDD